MAPCKTNLRLCWEHWHSRAARTGTQLGNSMKVQLTILIQITISWLPGTWFVLEKIDASGMSYIVNFLNGAGGHGYGLGNA